MNKRNCKFCSENSAELLDYKYSRKYFATIHQFCVYLMSACIVYITSPAVIHIISYKMSLGFHSSGQKKIF